MKINTIKIILLLIILISIIGITGFSQYNKGYKTGYSDGFEDGKPKVTGYYKEITFDEAFNLSKQMVFDRINYDKSQEYTKEYEELINKILEDNFVYNESDLMLFENPELLGGSLS